jgi:hypothetical protein
VLHKWLLANFDVEGEHDQLLREFLVFLVDWFENASRTNWKCKLSLWPHEALAFVQIWAQVTAEHDPYTNLLINDIVGSIDKNAKRRLLN